MLLLHIFIGFYLVNLCIFHLPQVSIDSLLLLNIFYNMKLLQANELINNLLNTVWILLA